jgi:hypothetical protein
MALSKVGPTNDRASGLDANASITISTAGVGDPDFGEPGFGLLSLVNSERL